MPLIEGSRSKNVLADSDSSSDLLNQASIPNGETVSVDKAKKSHNTEVSGMSYWCKVINNFKKKNINKNVIICFLHLQCMNLRAMIFVIVNFIKEKIVSLSEPEYIRFIRCRHPICYFFKSSPNTCRWCGWSAGSSRGCGLHIKSRYKAVYSSIWSSWWKCIFSPTDMKKKRNICIFF